MTIPFLPADATTLAALKERRSECMATLSVESNINANPELTDLDRAGAGAYLRRVRDEVKWLTNLINKLEQ